jgi:hypothetical protein
MSMMLVHAIGAQRPLASAGLRHNGAGIIVAAQ